MEYFIILTRTGLETFVVRHAVNSCMGLFAGIPAAENLNIATSKAITRFGFGRLSTWDKHQPNRAHVHIRSHRLY